MNMHSLWILITVALVTWLVRALPFAVFGMLRLPRIVVYLGRVLPPAIMAALVVYCLKGINITAAPYGLAELISVAVVAAVHVARRSTLLSIFLGTVCYMLLIRTILPI